MDLHSRISSDRGSSRSRDYGSAGEYNSYSNDRRRDYGDERRRRRRDDSEYRGRYRDDDRRYSSGRDRDDERDRKESRYSRDRHDRYDRNERRESRYSSRRRSRSPSYRSRPLNIERELEELKNVVPLNQWKRKRSMWDMKPPGYENVTADQAKMSGLFPLPGAPRSATADPEKLAAFARSTAGSIIAPPPPIQPGASRQARRLKVKELPAEFEVEDLKNVFEESISTSSFHKDRDTKHVTAIYPCKTERYAIIELATPEDATFIWGARKLKFKNETVLIDRLEGYIVPQISSEVAQKRPKNDLNQKVLDSADKVYIGSLPLYLNEDQISELLKPFGELQSLFLAKNSADMTSRGYAFCEYISSESATAAVQGLNNMEFGDTRLMVQFACVGIQQPVPSPRSVGMAALIELSKSSTEAAPTRVLQIHNLLDADETLDTEDYEDIRKSVQNKCNEYGQVLDLKLPRETSSSDNTSAPPGVGVTFVRFGSIKDAANALQHMSGLRFDDRSIVIAYYPEDCYKANAW
ncbi:U2AF large subunit [Schizosaccharomyces japonicus yFS275]|uniref:Splicing factor U2AF subunit n=1 Tax=Schizosaccharomyces japonicus (strain yFS275 / FY16936) TaxID=402676 RepID=B6K5L9_SCHJY|nr:U2AF large subunit [Schizosaccharomyces japonicus yFS275]EEB08823.2 U2AF large subunit [Schizosaccharomyces japonicus yFS275]